MDTTTRVVVFGAGAAGAIALSHLTNGERPICLADNDPDKIGSTCHGLAVVSPTALPDMDFDLVLVAGGEWLAVTRALESGATYVGLVDSSVLTTKPSRTFSVQEATGLSMESISTKHNLHEA